MTWMNFTANSESSEEAGFEKNYENKSNNF